MGWTGETNNLALAGDCVTSGNAILFQETDGLIITNISPASGPQAGGTPITITGTGFSQQMEAAFGANLIGITGDCPTTTQCSFQTPRWTGLSPVYITVGGDAAGSTFSGKVPAALFTYNAPPPSGVLRTLVGPPAGGTAIEADLTSVSRYAAAFRRLFGLCAIPAC